MPAEQNPLRPPRCPQCRTPLESVSGPNFPFCSERCALVDLGMWAGESYAIPGTSEEEGENEEEPSQ
ncbi:MAG: DNA gyrase inhibitor YacG [Acidobacteria bacterium]|nr:DNA gyrase inhibitor YacG [Acidobacteriota bacterium]